MEEATAALNDINRVLFSANPPSSLNINTLMTYVVDLESVVHNNPFFASIIKKILSYAAYITKRYDVLVPFADRFGIKLDTNCQQIRDVSQIRKTTQTMLEQIGRFIPEQEYNDYAGAINRLLNTISNLRCI